MTLAALKYVVNKELSSHGSRGYNLDTFNKKTKFQFQWLCNYLYFVEFNLKTQTDEADFWKKNRPLENFQLRHDEHHTILSEAHLALPVPVKWIIWNKNYIILYGCIIKIFPSDWEITYKVHFLKIVLEKIGSYKKHKKSHVEIN